MSLKSTNLILFILLLCPLQAFSQKELLHENKVYEPTINTVQVNFSGNSVQGAINPPVVKMNQKNLVLSFDDLKEDADYYYVYFIHCNADWTPSRLRPNMYMNAYNEFEIVNFEFSSEAKKKYVNYNFEIPSFKSSGNYLAVVYRDRNKEDIVLSHRFYVYEEKALAGLSVDRSTTPGKRLNNQRVEVTLNYTSLKATDPKTQFTVVVRQNQRPDLTTYNLPSTFIDENNKLIRYQNLGEANEFPGTNEFRSFDLGTVTFTGRNIQDTYIGSNSVAAQLRTDRPLTDSYLQSLDINGQFYITDLEGRPGQTTAEYVNTTFTLDYPKIDNDIYIIGAFNNWTKNEDSKMSFNEGTERYVVEVLVKQGWYNYAYAVDSENPFQIDGSFFDTENLYEVFIYYRPMGGRGDQLVAYNVLNYNSRR